MCTEYLLPTEYLPEKSNEAPREKNQITYLSLLRGRDVLTDTQNHHRNRLTCIQAQSEKWKQTMTTRRNDHKRRPKIATRQNLLTTKKNTKRSHHLGRPHMSAAPQIAMFQNSLISSGDQQRK